MEDLKLYDMNSGELSELIDSRRIVLRTKNEEYKNLRKEVSEIKEKYPNILALLEDNKIESLNTEECKNFKNYFHYVQEWQITKIEKYFF